MTPWKRKPKSEKRDKQDVASRVIPMEKKQIDYIMINRKYRNCAAKTYLIRVWGVGGKPGTTKTTWPSKNANFPTLRKNY